MLSGDADDVDDVTIAWRLLDTQFFGLAQRRERVFLCASFDPAIDAGSVLAEFDGQEGHPSTCREAQEAATGSGTGGAEDVIWPPVLGTLNASAAGMSRPAGQGNELDFVIVLADGTVRRPTPLECERAQGFPGGWSDIEINGRPALDIERYRSVGNFDVSPGRGIHRLPATPRCRKRRAGKDGGMTKKLTKAAAKKAAYDDAMRQQPEAQRQSKPRWVKHVWDEKADTLKTARWP